MDDAENIGAGTVRSIFLSFIGKDNYHLLAKIKLATWQVSHFTTHENDVAHTSGAGHGYAGFYLSYWQQSC